MLIQHAHQESTDSILQLKEAHLTTKTLIFGQDVESVEVAFWLSQTFSRFNRFILIQHGVPEFNIFNISSERCNSPEKETHFLERQLYQKNTFHFSSFFPTPALSLPMLQNRKGSGGKGGGGLGESMPYWRGWGKGGCTGM